MIVFLYLTILYYCTDILA
ncbi:unnamed protein product [Acanthoscelides obtectus]|uniref:Uncharacterized protein n=1 Tax=Acanthoscelides obtectus TaxID=200917 RepID=A0A9P0KM61_ACAOB|nr:unnamed protein product [Acanthoscelides obtectus]CAK1665168.1 hypothetical protein AOBTE_LOCUS24691 [Acanthoscelides obtectus]